MRCNPPKPSLSPLLAILAGLLASLVEGGSPAGFQEIEVRFSNGPIQLAGTLTLPDGQGPFPAAAMITGSGPQNRDEELFGFRPFRLIAEHLSRRGVAVLRWDDRGVGGSSGNVWQSTGRDFAIDAAAAVRFLAERPDIDADRIGLIGHSEGGAMAPLAAQQGAKVAFLVLLAGTAVDGETILLAQAEKTLRANGAGTELVKANSHAQKLIFKAVRSDQGWEEAREAVVEVAKLELELLPEAQRKAINGEIYAQRKAGGQLQALQFQKKWWRYFLDYDPAPDLEKTTCPVLGLFGELDLQVPHDLNRPAMQDALKRGGNRDFEIRVLPGVNHLFQKAVTGSPSEYARLEKTFAPGVLEIIGEWIWARVGP